MAHIVRALFVLRNSVLFAYYEGVFVSVLILAGFLGLIATYAVALVHYDRPPLPEEQEPMVRPPVEVTQDRWNPPGGKAWEALDL